MKNRNKSTTNIDNSYTRYRVFFTLFFKIQFYCNIKKTAPVKPGLLLVDLRLIILVRPEILLVIENPILNVFTFKQAKNRIVNKCS